LFGLVLAIGIVVDDAIVVVEKRRAHIEAADAARGELPRDARSHQSDHRDRAGAGVGVRALAFISE